MSASAVESIVAINAAAYDERPSGAKARAVGLAAAFLRAGCRVRMYAGSSCGLEVLVAAEYGPGYPEDRFERFSPSFLDLPKARRLLAERRWFDSRLTRDNDLFVTDYRPVLTRIPTVLTAHDLRHFAAPRFESMARNIAFRATFPRLARRAHVIVAPTAAVAAEAKRYLGVDAVVAGNAVSRAWRTAGTSREVRGHLLMVGFAEPRKDLATVLAAHRRTPSAPPLVVVGRGKPPGDVPERVRFVRDADDDELVELMRGAAALLHPSRYEGFGLPVLEAMSVGVPVLAARIPAVEEVAGGFATLLPPGDVDAWAAALTSIPATAPGARDHALSFTWDASAAAVLTAARAVASSE